MNEDCCKRIYSHQLSSVQIVKECNGCQSLSWFWEKICLLQKQNDGTSHCNQYQHIQYTLHDLRLQQYQKLHPSIINY